MNQASDDAFRGKRILVVEDEFLIAIETQRILEDAGAGDVVLAARLQEAAELLRNGSTFDIAVLDMRLGDQSGEPIALTLLARNIPFVFGTGFGVSAVNDRHLAHVPLVEKPYTAETLLAGLDLALRSAEKAR